jgi:hypothetical protein
VSEGRVKKAFGSVWWRFLEFEISRSKLMIEVAGNPVSALILQVVAYHHLTVVQASLNKETYDEIRRQWELSDIDINSDMPQKLSYAAITDITGIDKETVRRSVKRLNEQEWVVVDQKTGIHYRPSVANQDKLLMLNEWELANFGRLMKLLERSTELN